MTCSECKNDFNFGQTIIDFRDLADAALDDIKLPQLAWYHTTTDPEWPRLSKPLADDVVRHLRQRASWPEEQIERYRRVHENQAIHLVVCLSFG